MKFGQWLKEKDNDTFTNLFLDKGFIINKKETKKFDGVTILNHPKGYDVVVDLKTRNVDLMKGNTPIYNGFKITELIKILNTIKL